MTTTVPEQLARAYAALHRLLAAVPGTKGLGPKDHADRLHAELERRITIAKAAGPQEGDEAP